MNILVVAAHGLYADYGASFVHSQAKEYVKAGHRVRAIVPVAAGKRGCDVPRLSAPIVRVVRDGVEIFYLRYLSLGRLSSPPTAGTPISPSPRRSGSGRGGYARRRITLLPSAAYMRKRHAASARMCLYRAYSTASTCRMCARPKRKNTA